VQDRQTEANPQRILIVRLSALGDTALTLPLARLLKQRWPDLHLGWVVGEQAAPLLRGLDDIDRLHVLEQSQRHPAGLWRLAREVRRQDYRIALDPQGLSLSALLPWLAGIPRRVGFAPGPLESRELAPLLLNRRIRVPRGITHITERTLYLSTALGIDAPSRLPVRLPQNRQAEQRIGHWWQQQGLTGNTLVMGLGAGWPTKIWPAEQVAVLARAAGKEGLRVVLLWGPAERRRLAAWQAVFGDAAVMAPQTDIPGMLELLRRARCYAGPDSAALHLAWLLGRPSFSWFGASDPARCAPTGEGHVHVAQGPHNWRRSAWPGNPLTGLQSERVLPVFHRWLRSLNLGD
jgi:heptosyltransferase-1